MSRTTERQRAVALKAADARELIKSSLPFALQQMSAAQIDQVQRVLDSYVVNPAVQKEADALYRQSVLPQSSGVVVVRDPAIVRRAEKVMEDYIPIKEADFNLRLNFEKLLTPEALKPTSDNPDEAMYLQKVKQTLASKGVWLWILPKTVPMTGDLTFNIWLTLGPNGDGFKTDTGRLDRDALLSNTTLGAGYYQQVWKGKVQTALHKAINRVNSQIEAGIMLHNKVAADRRTAFPGVVEYSDSLGAAKFPDKSIWDRPSEVHMLALSQNSRGNVKAPARAIVIAALLTKIAARTLANYIEATQVGAERMVKVLDVLVAAGKIAEVVLVVDAVATALVRVMATEATATGAGEGAVKVARKGIKSPEANYPTNYAGRAAFEKTIDRAGITLDTGGGADMALNRYDIAFRTRLKAYNEFVWKEMGTWPQGHVPIADMDALLERADARFGKVWEELG